MALFRSDPDPEVEKIVKLKRLFETITSMAKSLPDKLITCLKFRQIRETTNAVIRAVKDDDAYPGDTDEIWLFAHLPTRNALEVIRDSSKEYIQTKAVVSLLLTFEHARLCLAYCDKCVANDVCPASCWALQVWEDFISKNSRPGGWGK